MRRHVAKRVGFGLSALALIAGGTLIPLRVASADTVTAASLASTGNQSKQQGSTGTAEFYLLATNTPSGDPNACDANPANPVTIKVRSSSTFITFPNGDSQQLTACPANPATNPSPATSISYKVSAAATVGTVITLDTITSGGRQTPSVSKFNEASFSVTVTAGDSTKPTVSATASPAGTWVNTDPVKVTIHAADETVLKSIAYSEGDPSNLSSTTVSGGAKTADLEVDVSGNGVHTLYFSATDGAGNVSDTGSITVRIDTLAPTLNGQIQESVSGTDPANVDWYKGDVHVLWTPSDQTGLSGINAATAPATSTVSGEGTNLSTASVTVSDNAGNVSQPTSKGGINIDRTKPSITSTLSGDAGQSGWYTGPVTVHYACADQQGLSGVANCSGDDVISTQSASNQSTGNASDYAGNTNSTTVTGIKIDSTAPQSAAAISCTGKNGFCRSTATVTLSATDNLSGVAAIKVKVGNQGSYTNYNPNGETVPLNGNGTARVFFYAIDQAGNAEPEQSASILYDTIAPDVTVTHPGKNAAGWNNSDFTTTFTATDPADGVTGDLGSGVETLTVEGSVVASNTTVGSQTPLSYGRPVNVETSGTNLAAFAEDFAGNVSSTVTETVKLDKTKPTISGTRSPAANTNGWNNGTVTVKFTCADQGGVQSGIAECTGWSGNQNDGIDVTTEGANQSVTGTANDRADNSAQATVGSISIDLTNPTITNLTVANGGQYTLGAVPSATCTAADGLSGPDGCTVVVTAPASGVGTFTFVATATDKAGNTTTQSGSFSVIYRWDGFLQPINDTAHQVGTSVSVFKAGSTIPVKFQLKTANGSIVQAAATPQWLAPVKGVATTLAVDEAVYGDAVTSGNTYRWDTTTSQYQYNWGSSKNGAPYYWRIGVKLDDGQTYWVSIGLR